MRIRRKHRSDDDVVIDLTDDAHAWWAAADDLVTVAPSYATAEAAAAAPPDPPDLWAPELVYTWGPPDPHDVLGVPRDASWADIERARRRLAKAHHPDLAPHASPVEIDLRERRMQAVNQAYDEIKQSRFTPGVH